MEENFVHRLCPKLSNPEELPYGVLPHIPSPPQYDPKEVALTGIADSGARLTYASGALREPPTGKGRPELISPFALKRLAQWYEKGAEKYASRNWEKGIDFERCTGSMGRHLISWMMGMDDEDHLAAIAWNAFAIMHYQELGMTELDNMPNYGKGNGDKHE